MKTPTLPTNAAALRVSVNALEFKSGCRPLGLTATRYLCAGIKVEPEGTEIDDFILCHVPQYDQSVWIERRFL